MTSLYSHNLQINIPRRTLRELATYGLIRLDSTGGSAYEILFLQELRNAVETEFEVSDYFVTMNAVGNIIINSTTGTVQGIGFNSGTIYQSADQLADFMVSTLGETFLETQRELKDAIDNLRQSAESEQQSKLGKVISELGRCLEHGANTAAVITALVVSAPYLQQIIGG